MLLFLTFASNSLCTNNCTKSQTDFSLGLSFSEPLCYDNDSKNQEVSL